MFLFVVVVVNASLCCGVTEPQPSDEEELEP